MDREMEPSEVAMTPPSGIALAPIKPWETSCLLCKSENIKPAFSKEGVEWVLCEQCGSYTALNPKQGTHITNREVERATLEKLGMIPGRRIVLIDELLTSDPNELLKEHCHEAAILVCQEFVAMRTTKKIEQKITPYYTNLPTAGGLALAMKRYGFTVAEYINPTTYIYGHGISRI